MPLTILISLLTIPLALRTTTGLFRNYNNVEKLIPVLGLNVKTLLSTIFLLIIGYLFHSVI